MPKDNSIHLYEGLCFTLPQQPDKIAGWDLPQKDQKWRRTEFPEKWVNLSDEELEADPEYQQFAFEEDRKCTEGYWFFNNGVATYISGDHYHYVNWFKIDTGYPQYRDRDRRWFYHWYMCDTDVDCLGQDYGKLRRDGYSYRVVSIILNRARKTFNSNYGLISKTGIDAQEMFDKLIHGFLEYPIFFKPQVQSAEDVRKKLVFKTPQQRVTHKNRKTTKEISLNTKIDWKNTKENSYDGHKLKILVGDEVGKFEEANAEKWFNIAKTCCMLGSKIIGKLFFGSTVNESKKGGAAFKTIWNNSSLKNKTSNGRTVSGLYRYFVSAEDGLEGFIDEYGMSVIETPKKPVRGIDGELINIGSREYLQNELESLKAAGDLIGYYEQMRKFPRTEEEMFREASNEEVIFPVDKIYEQLDYNDSIDLPIVRGNFIWKAVDQEVEWHPDKTGRWTVAWLPKPEERNKFITQFGRKSPANTHVGVFGLDPFDGKWVVDKKRASNAGNYGLKKHDPLDADNSNIFILEYLCRPPDPMDMYEDMIKMCFFYGWKVLIERNRNGCIRYFESRGYQNYLMKRVAEVQSEHLENAKAQEDYGVPMSGEKDRGALLEVSTHYIYNNIGRNSQTGKMGKCYFNSLLKEWLEFTPEKWTDFDAVVGAGLAIIASREYIPKKPQTTTKPEELFSKFKAVGNRSVKI